MPYSFHFFYSWPRLCTEELTVTNIKIAIKTSIASSRYWKSVDQTKDVLNNLSQFRFLYYNSGNIPLHLELSKAFNCRRYLQRISQQSKSFNRLQLTKRENTIKILWKASKENMGICYVCAIMQTNHIAHIKKR